MKKHERLFARLRELHAEIAAKVQAANADAERLNRELKKLSQREEELRADISDELIGLEFDLTEDGRVIPRWLDDARDRYDRMAAYELYGLDDEDRWGWEN